MTLGLIPEILGVVDVMMTVCKELGMVNGESRTHPAPLQQSEYSMLSGMALRSITGIRVAASGMILVYSSLF